MKSMGLAVLAVMTVLMTLSLPASAVEILEERTHGDWNSFIVATPSDAVARMTTTQDATMLAIDVRSGPSLSSWSIRMLENLSPEDRAHADFADGFFLYGQMRVDKGRLYDVRFDFRAQDDVLIIAMSGNFHESFLYEASHGSLLRVKVDDADPVFLRFSLDGFEEAFSRCMKLSDAIGNVFPPDEDFFESPDRSLEDVYGPEVRSL